MLKTIEHDEIQALGYDVTIGFETRLPRTVFPTRSSRQVHREVTTLDPCSRCRYVVDQSVAATPIGKGRQSRSTTPGRAIAAGSLRQHV